MTTLLIHKRLVWYLWWTRYLCSDLFSLICVVVETLARFLFLFMNSVTFIMYGCVWCPCTDSADAGDKSSLVRLTMMRIKHICPAPPFSVGMYVPKAQIWMRVKRAFTLVSLSAEAFKWSWITQGPRGSGGPVEMKTWRFCHPLCNVCFLECILRVCIRVWC